MTVKYIYKSSWFVKVVFVLGLFLILFIAGLGYKHISDVSKSQDLTLKSYQINLELMSMLSMLKDAQIIQDRYFITRKNTPQEKLSSYKENIIHSFNKLNVLVSGHAAQEKNIKSLRLTIDKYLENFKDVKEVLNFDAAFLKKKSLIGIIDKKVNHIISLEEERQKNKEEAYQTTIKFTPIFLYGLIVTTLLLMYVIYVKINNNLEELKRKNQELKVFKESTNQSEIINKHGSWRWDIEDDKFHFSDNLFRLLGEEPKSFDHNISNFMKFVHPDDVEKLSSQVDQMKEDRDLPFIHYRVVHKDGSIHYLKAYGKSIVNTEGKVQLLGTTTDITDEIDAFNTLEQRNQELELNNKELAAFNYVASHDLQEPLRKIQTFLSRLEDSEAATFTDKGKAYIKRIHVSATRMRLLIDDLLQYSRTNKSTEKLKASNVNSILENSIQDMSETILATQAKINTPHFPDMMVIPFQVQQLFYNLISNALKYHYKGRDLQIDIKYNTVLKQDDKRLQNGFSEAYHKITFKDNGIGFKQEYADTIFELFNRLHNKDEYTGTGIGLSICKKIVDNHQGFIFAHGEPDVGAVFECFLPINAQ